MKFIIITKKKWDIKNFKNLNNNITVLTTLNKKKIKKINPKIIFFIHWSKIINKSLYKNYLCIQFHSSNLPEGRGGSPIQNQIIQNKNVTKLTAFKISKHLDSGPICLKRNLSLKGNAIDIFKRMESISIKMVKTIINKKKINFIKQKGRISFYKRRKPYQSELKIDKKMNIQYLYNFFRMLDAPGYPKGFIKVNKFKLELYNLKKINNTIIASVKINKNEK